MSDVVVQGPGPVEGRAVNVVMNVLAVPVGAPSSESGFPFDATVLMTVVGLVLAAAGALVLQGVERSDETSLVGWIGTQSDPTDKWFRLSRFFYESALSWRIYGVCLLASGLLVGAQVWLTRAW